MSNETTSNKPNYRIIRYYGDEGPRAEIGAIWKTDKGLSITLNTLQGQIKLMAFPIESREAEGGAQ